MCVLATEPKSCESTWVNMQEPGAPLPLQELCAVRRKGRKDTSVLFLSGPPPLVAGSGGPTDIVALHKNTGKSLGRG